MGHPSLLTCTGSLHCMVAPRTLPSIAGLQLILGTGVLALSLCFSSNTTAARGAARTAHYLRCAFHRLRCMRVVFSLWPLIGTHVDGRFCGRGRYCGSSPQFQIRDVRGYPCIARTSLDRMAVPGNRQPFQVRGMFILFAIPRYSLPFSHVRHLLPSAPAQWHELMPGSSFRPSSCPGDRGPHRVTLPRTLPAGSFYYSTTAPIAFTTVTTLRALPLPHTAHTHAPSHRFATPRTHAAHCHVLPAHPSYTLHTRTMHTHCTLPHTPCPLLQLHQSFCPVSPFVRTHRATRRFVVAYAV